MHSRPRTVRVKLCLPPSSSGVGACSVQVRSRGLVRERWARVYPLPASVDLTLGASLVRIRTASAPPGCLHAPQFSPRTAPMLTPRAQCRPLCWRSLVQEGPTSDVLVASRARITGSSRLTAASERACTLRCRAPGGFTRSARPVSRPPREGRPFDEPGRLRPYREASRAFAREVQPRASSGRI